MVTKRTTQFIASFEGFRSKRYRDANGHWTIGFGHLCTDSTPHKISYDYALFLLSCDVQVHHDELVRFIDESEDGLHCYLMPNELDAFVSLVYNIGMPNFRKYSISGLLLCYVKSRKNLSLEESKSLRIEIANKFYSYIYAGDKPLNGLRYRRGAESHRFLTPYYD